MLLQLLMEEEEAGRTWTASTEEEDEERARCLLSVCLLMGCTVTDSQLKRCTARAPAAAGDPCKALPSLQV